MSDTIEISTEETQTTTTSTLDAETEMIYNLIIQMQTNYNERIASSDFNNIQEDRIKTDLQCSIIRDEMDKIKEQLGRDVTKYEILQANNYYHSITTFVSQEQTITTDEPMITDETIVADETIITDETIMTDETMITDETTTDQTTTDQTIIQ
jgi:hypothetical protein